jgi:signal recognition particle receptor subunit beta
MTSIIYLLESEQRAAQSIVNVAIQSGYEIYIFRRFADLLTDIKTHRPDAIVMNYRLLPETYDELRVISNYFTLIFGDRIDLDVRTNYYQFGINRVLDGQYSKPEILIRLLKFPSVYQKDVPSPLPKNTIQKSLKDFSLVNFLNRSIHERKSAAMKLIDNGLLARLKVVEGNIAHAWFGDKTGDDAVLQLLHYSRGILSYREFSDRLDVTPMGSSTYGLLQEFRFQSRKMQEFLDRSRSENPLFVLKNQTVIADEDSASFRILKIIEPRSSLKKLLKESDLNVYTAIRTLQDLMEQKIIDLDSDDATAEDFSDDDKEVMVEAFFRPGWENASLLILGSTDSSKSHMIDAIASCTGRKVVRDSGVDITDLPLGPDSRLFFLGIAMEEQLPTLLPGLTTQLVGCILLIDFAQKISFDYKKYFLRQFLAEYKIPLVIGVMNVTKMTEQVVSELKKKLEIPADIPVLAINPDDFSGIRSAVMGLTRRMQVHE